MKSHFIRSTQGFLMALGILAVTSSLLLAQDPVKVAPTMYKLISENARVRILDATLAPGQKTVMHSHPDLVSVILEPSTVRWTMPDGKTADSPADAKRGSVMFNAAGKHISENTGKTKLRAILIEFKQPAPAAGKGANPSIPAPFKQVLDNAYVRVFDGTSSPGMKMAEHTHSDHVTIALSNGTAEVTDKAGKKETLTFKKDTAQFTGPATHSAVNTGKTSIHLVDVELK